MDELQTQVIGLATRLAVVEKILTEYEARISLQLGIIIADIESEKGTRQRLHANWEKEVEKVQTRLVSLERHVSIGIGIITALQVLIPVLLRVFKP